MVVNIQDVCRLAPAIQGRRTGPAQKGEHPARLNSVTNQQTNLLPPAPVSPQCNRTRRSSAEMDTTAREQVGCQRHELATSEL